MERGLYSHIYSVIPYLLTTKKNLLAQACSTHIYSYKHEGVYTKIQDIHQNVKSYSLWVVNLQNSYSLPFISSLFFYYEHLWQIKKTVSDTTDYDHHMPLRKHTQTWVLGRGMGVGGAMGRWGTGCTSEACDSKNSTSLLRQLPNCIPQKSSTSVTQRRINV